MVYTPSVSMSLSTTTGTASESSDSTTTPSNPADQSTTSNTPLLPAAESKPNTSVKVGVAVGVTAIAVLGLAGAAYFFLRRRRRRNHGPATETIDEDKAISSADEKKGFVAEHNAAELGDDGPVEMYSPPVEQRGFVSELPGSEVFPETTKGARPVSELDATGGGSSAEKYK